MILKDDQLQLRYDYFKNLESKLVGVGDTGERIDAILLELSRLRNEIETIRPQLEDSTENKTAEQLPPAATEETKDTVEKEKGEDQEITKVTKEKPLPCSPEELRPGDHIYSGRWLKYRHGIVATNDIEHDVTVVEFYSDPQSKNEAEKVGIVRLEEFCRGNEVYKVQYSVKLLDCAFSVPGTLSNDAKDPLPLVRARLNFILSNRNLLPNYDKKTAFDECLCVWIATGKYLSHQIRSVLNLATGGQAFNSLGVTGLVTTMRVTTTSTRLFGLAAVESTTPLIAACPAVVPGLVAFGLLSLVPMVEAKRLERKWHENEKRLNFAFVEYLGSYECIVDTVSQRDAMNWM